MIKRKRKMTEQAQCS